MSKKIFFVLDGLSGGGAEKFWIRLANIFADKGFNVSLVPLNKNPQNYLSLINPKIKLIYFKKHNLFLQAYLLGRFFKKEHPDIILSTLTRANNICVMATLLSGIKTKLFVRNTSTLSQTRQNKGNFRIILARILYPYAAGIISLSKGVHEDCIQLGIKNKNMTVIYNFIDQAQITKLSKESIPSFRINNGPCILAASRFSENKRLDYIIRAFHALTEQYPTYQHATLCILGKGSAAMQQKLEKLIHTLNLQNKVFLKGFFENPYPFFVQTDLFVHASKTEGLSNILLAALALKCNIVATDCPSGPKEILENGTYGRLIPVSDDISILTKAMHDALEKPMDKNKFIHAVDKFSVDPIVQQYMDTIKN